MENTNETVLTSEDEAMMKANMIIEGFSALIVIIAIVLGGFIIYGI